MLNIAGQAGTDAQKSTTVDCTNVKPQLHKTQCCTFAKSTCILNCMSNLIKGNFIRLSCGKIIFKECIDGRWLIYNPCKT